MVAAVVGAFPEAGAVGFQELDGTHCTCLDHERRHVKCKHIFAVQFVSERERHEDGSTAVTETLIVTETVEVKRTTYTQDWPAYNAAQAVEKDRVQELLFDLCGNVPEPERTGCGRKPHTVKDSIFFDGLQGVQYVQQSAALVRLAGRPRTRYLSKPIPGMKTVRFFENPELTTILKQLIHLSSLPLKAVETDFAIDSSGFGSCRFEQWIDEKYGTPRKKAVWVKAHIACGVKTNIVTAVRILDKDAGDSPQFVPLLKETADGFTIGEVSADKAYGSVENFETVAGFGGAGFIAFKSNATGVCGGHYEKAFH